MSCTKSPASTLALKPGSKQVLLPGNAVPALLILACQSSSVKYVGNKTLTQLTRILTSKSELSRRAHGPLVNWITTKIKFTPFTRFPRTTQPSTSAKKNLLSKFTRWSHASPSLASHSRLHALTTTLPKSLSSFPSWTKTVTSCT